MFTADIKDRKTIKHFNFRAKLISAIDKSFRKKITNILQGDC